MSSLLCRLRYQSTYKMMELQGRQVWVRKMSAMENLKSHIIHHRRTIITGRVLYLPNNWAELLKVESQDLGLNRYDWKTYKSIKLLNSLCYATVRFFHSCKLLSKTFLFHWWTWHKNASVLLLDNTKKNASVSQNSIHFFSILIQFYFGHTEKFLHF
jgi:hypothetical protein